MKQMIYRFMGHTFQYFEANSHQVLITAFALLIFSTIVMSAHTSPVPGAETSPPSPPPPSPPLLQSPQTFSQPEVHDESTLSETIHIGSRYISIQGSQFDSRRHVYYMSHRANTLDWLFNFGGSQSRWWRFLDLARGRYPEWFLPRTFVLKIYEPGENNDDMRPSLRASNEFEAYKKLERYQGRGVPRCYGSVMVRYCPALLLQYMDGVTLDEWFSLNKSTTTVSVPSVSTAQESLVGYDSDTDRQRIEILSMAGKIAELTRMLNACGVKGDFKVDNIICGKSTVSMLDFDISDEDSQHWVETENLGGWREMFKIWCSSQGLGDFFHSVAFDV
jgi:hypothetical protein